jgi:uncharacterized coiled-coil protein SlyX
VAVAVAPGLPEGDGDRAAGELLAWVPPGHMPPALARVTPPADARRVLAVQELSALPTAELASQLAEAYRVIGELTAQVGRLPARVEQLERQAGRDSSTSSRPPSSDSPHKKGRDWSLRETGSQASSQVSLG